MLSRIAFESQPGAMQKKLYFELMDGDDYHSVMELDKCMLYIKSRIHELPPIYMNDQKYTLTPVYLTDEEFNNLPES